MFKLLYLSTQFFPKLFYSFVPKILYYGCFIPQSFVLLTYVSLNVYDV